MATGVRVLDGVAREAYDDDRHGRDAGGGVERDTGNASGKDVSETVKRGRQADGDYRNQPQRHAAAAVVKRTLAGPKGKLACNAGDEDHQQKEEQVPGAHGLAALPGGDAEPDDCQHDAQTGEPGRRPDEVLAHPPEVHEGVSAELDRVVEVDEGIPDGAEPVLNDPDVVGVVLRG